MLAYALTGEGVPNGERMEVLGAPPATPLRWGSITKTVTALTLINLSAGKGIDLESELSAHVNPNAWRNDFEHPVRLIHLLELTAGFTDLSREEFDYNEPLTLQQALALNPTHRRTHWPPGFHHSYSNLVPGLSQLFIEQVSGTSYAEAAQQYVLQPLGMSGAGFVPRIGLPGGFKADGVTPIPYWHMTYPAFGALNAPLEDLVTLVGAMQDPGDRRLTDLARKHLFKNHSTLGARNGFHFDYAAGLYPRVREGRVWWGHGGDADGYRSRMAFMPDLQRGYVALINTDNPKILRRIESLLEAYLTHDTTPGPAPRFDPDKVILTDYEGVLRPVTARFGAGRLTDPDNVAHLRLSAAGDSLVFLRGNKSTILIPVSASEFRRETDPVATVGFATDQGATYMQGELGNYVIVERPPGGRQKDAR